MTNPNHERDLCGHCDRWREEHYDHQGAWLEEQPCSEYFGVMAAPDRRKKREKETSYLYDDGPVAPHA